MAVLILALAFVLFVVVLFVVVLFGVHDYSPDFSALIGTNVVVAFEYEFLVGAIQVIIRASFEQISILLNSFAHTCLSLILKLLGSGKES